MTSPTRAPAEAASAHGVATAIVDNVAGVVLGKREQIVLVVAGLLAKGHVLLEDVPGVGKTLLAKSLARSIGGSAGRIQGTADLMPADITGVSIFDRARSAWEFHPGPIFHSVVLVDEINRATPRAQSALLEAMAEGQVTVDGTAHPLPEPFFVIATQNPYGDFGTFPLVEGQCDRFALVVSLGVPDRDAERAMLQGDGGPNSLERLGPVVDGRSLIAARDVVDRIHVAAPVADYVLDLVAATRSHPELDHGASPRAARALLQVAKGHAVLGERDFVAPDDVKAVASAVLAHRLGAVARGGHETARRLVDEIVGHVNAARLCDAVTVDRRLPPAADRNPGRRDNQATVGAGSRSRQLRVKPAGLGGAGLAVVAFTVWWSGGPRLALFMSVAVGAMVVIDAVWASVATRRARVRFTSAPADTVAGDVVALGVSVAGLHHALLVKVGSAGALLALPPAQGPVRAVFPRRGVVTELVIEVESRGLCALVGYARRHTSPLPRPLAVGPRPENPKQPLPESSGSWSEGRPRPAPTGDVVRGLREYAPGDSARSVHWRATARFDDLMVKEVEEPGSRELFVALDMGSGGDPGERAAAVAAWYVVEALQRGYRVVLATVEPSGPVTVAVRSSHDLNCRLAAAAPGRPKTPPGGQEVLMVAAGTG